MTSPGDEAAEGKHNFQGNKTYSGTYIRRVWRDARRGGWFSYDLKVLPDKPMALMITYWGSSIRRTFDILVDGNKIATQTLAGKKPGNFHQEEYTIPAQLTRGKTRSP